MKRILITLTTLLILLVSSQAWAAYYVYSGGSATPPYGSWGAAATTLAQINAVSLTSGDHQIYLRASEDFTGYLASTNWTDGVTSITISGVNEDLSDATGTDRPRILGGEGYESGGEGDIYFSHIGVNKTITVTIEDIQWVDQDYNIEDNMFAVSFLGVTGVMIDGVVADGEVNTSTDTSEAVYNTALSIQWMTGAIEIKNSTFQYWGPPCLWASPEVPSNELAYTHYDCHAIIITNDVGVVTISVHDNIIKNVDADGMQIEYINGGGQSNIYNNTFYNCGENAVDWKWSDNVDIYNNVVYRDATFVGLGGSSAGGGVAASGLLQWLAQEDNGDYSNVKIRDNYLGPSDTSAIAFRQWGTPTVTLTNFQVYGNWIRDIGFGILIAGYAMDGIEVFNNVIDGVKADGNFVFDATTSYADPTANYYHHNTFYCNTDMGSGLYFNSSASHLYNNIFYMNDSDSYMMNMDSGGTYTSMLFDGNIWYNADAGDDNIINWDGATVYDESELTDWKARAEVGTSEMFENPDMVDPANDQFWGDAEADACVDGGVAEAQSEISETNSGLKNDST